jgi:D-psicose/D-tagatose/L-ribulose 3-epimerase
MELLADANHPNLYVHLDSYHMNIEEPSMEMAVRLCGEKLGYVHLGESHRGYMGSGSVDFEGLFRGLAEIDYRGPITFESFSSAVVSEDLSNNLCVWRNLWSDSSDLAEHAQGYIDTHWSAALITARQAKTAGAVIV